MLSGNRGEWSEVYALLKILSDKILFAGDENLNTIEGLIFPVIKILRDESHGTYQFSYENDLVLIQGNQEEFRLPLVDFHTQAVFLLKKLKGPRTSAFSIPEIEEFINSFNCKSLKAKSSAKSDIRIIIHDKRTGTMPLLSFSIKSQLGHASTLLNAGRSTNFVYEITGTQLSTRSIEQINSISTRTKIKDRIEEIHKLSGTLKFHSTENLVFGNNLALIDSSLAFILAEVVKNYFTSPLSKMPDLVLDITTKNPLNYDLKNNHPFYFYKIKRFLTDAALGMMPSKVWTGEFDATGGFLVVKNDGEIRCYHIYNKNEFEDYLLNNTRLETASSSRHCFGKIYQDGSKYKLKLNLQIRFIK